MKYQGISDSHIFELVAFETTGASGPTTLRLSRRMADGEWLIRESETAGRPHGSVRVSQWPLLGAMPLPLMVASLLTPYNGVSSQYHLLTMTLFIRILCA